MNLLDQGKELFNKAQYDGTIEVLSEFLVHHINNADALYYRAISYRKTGDYKSSIVDFTAMLKKLPEEAIIYSERGVSYFHNKQLDLALKDMNKAVELEPENPYRYSSRAFILAYKDVDAAILDYKKAIELDPKDDIAYNNLGLLEENAGHFKEAKESFDKSNELIGYNPEKRQEKKIEPQPEIKNNTMRSLITSIFTSKAARKDFFCFLKQIFRKG
ncbi:MAG: tetratricopeptide repeat protein [Vicingaceae bacterium]|nr:tetratricopeptide repeat protein [Vicingaceae bacterium]